MKKTTISATELARQLGDVLGRIRYRGEAFEVERNGKVVARLEPAGTSREGTVAGALRAWQQSGERDDAFADALERVGKADREPANPWAS
jgi:antitoxin (DNA-binding transcriptional repressor) of toxin-antitoxin stability system